VNPPDTAAVDTVPPALLGTPVLRREDHHLLTGRGTFVANLPVAGAAHVTYLRSPFAHARILHLDAAAARAADGVLAVLTAEDIDLPMVPPERLTVDSRMSRPLIAREVVRFAGEIVAVIAAETVAQGLDAAALVDVDYDPLPALIDVQDALTGGVLVFPDAGSNVATRIGPPPVPDDDLFADCEIVVRQRIVHQRLAPVPLETRAVVARWSPDGGLTVHVSTQKPHVVRDELARTFGLDPATVRVVVPDVGGGFGAKCGGYPDELLVAEVARQVGRPARWVETRSESMISLGHGRGQVHEAALGGDRDGTLKAYRLDIVQDAGAYPRLGAWLPVLTRLMASGVYTIPSVSCTAVSVVTTTTPVTAYRGAGRPEAARTLERMVDLFAVEAGLDPIALRRRNLLQPNDFPYRTPTGAIYDTGNYPLVLDRVLALADHPRLSAERDRRRRAGDPQLPGVGVAVFVEVTNAAPPPEHASAQARPDGQFVIRSGNSPHGQGQETVWAMIAADTLQVPTDQIEVRFGDTSDVPRGAGSFSSRSGQVGGSAVHRACQELIRQGLPWAAKLLRPGSDQVRYDGARFRLADDPDRSVTWSQVASASGGLRAEVDLQCGATYAFGAYLAAVDVDSDTGAVRLNGLWAVDDAGRLLNPMIAHGQVLGGAAQGIGEVLFEQASFDETGNPVTANLVTYSIASAVDLPRMTTAHTQTLTPVNPLGVKGIGESGVVGAGAAVHNAVIDALGPHGIRHLDSPLDPWRIWRALHDAPPHLA